MTMRVLTRMMIRILAFALLAREGLTFAAGLSDVDEPDFWEKDFTGAIRLWVEVGTPDERRLRKACGRAEQVVVLCYGTSADIWWGDINNSLTRLSNLRVLLIPSDAAQSLARLAQRSMRLECTIQEGQIMITDTDHVVTLELDILKEAHG